MHIRRTYGNDVAQEREVNLRFPIKRRYRRSTQKRYTRSFINCATHLAMSRNLPIGLHLYPLGLLRRRTFPINMQFRDNVCGVRQTPTAAAPQGKLPDNPKSSEGFKTIRPTARER